MAATPARKPARYADVLALPPHLAGEIVDGELYVHPRPAPRHLSVAGRLMRRIGTPFEDGVGGPGGWWVLAEPELHLVAEEPVVPDLAGWRKARLPALPTAAYFALSPDWVCEVLSPSTEALDRGPKMSLYARHNVPHIWRVDPIEQTLEAYRNDAGTFRPSGRWQGAKRAPVAPFDDVELDLGALWGGAP